MQSILIPIAIIVRNPLSEHKVDRFLELAGWVECLLSPIPHPDQEINDVELRVALTLKVPDASRSMGIISDASADRVKLTRVGAVILEKQFTINGRPEGAALSLVVRIFANHVEISHLRLVAQQDETGL
jgi:hypothetical protein